MPSFYFGQRVRVNCRQSPHHNTETRVRTPWVKTIFDDGWVDFSVEVFIPYDLGPEWEFCMFHPEDLIPIIDHHEKAEGWDFMEYLFNQEETVWPK